MWYYALIMGGFYRTWRWIRRRSKFIDEQVRAGEFPHARSGRSGGDQDWREIDFQMDPETMAR